jgi:hypothetical protein
VTEGKVASTQSVDYGKVAENDSRTEQAANLYAYHAVQPSKLASPNRCSKVPYDPRWVETGMQKAEERVGVRY